MRRETEWNNVAAKPTVTTDKGTVVIDREKFIGGSDIPIIMGLSAFMKKWELLQFKAGLKERDFFGNEYTRYGDEMEPVIRDFINEKYGRNFEPCVWIQGDLRGNTDGLDDLGLLEVKTTSHIYKTLDEYKAYLVQMIFYCVLFKRTNCYLAVYERPEDFSTVFEEERLYVYYMDLYDYADLAAEVEDAIEEFRTDLARLRENPLLTEEDFIPNEIVSIGTEVVALERELKELKQKEADLKSLKEDLKVAMEHAGIKSWKTYNGTTITLVADGEDKEVEEFDAKSFIEEYPTISRKFMVKKTKKGRKGYVKITI